MPGTQTKGRDRDDLRARVVRAYAIDGLPIRTIAADIGRSFGMTRNLLVEAGISFRPRGGSTRTEALGSGEPRWPDGHLSPAHSRWCQWFFGDRCDCGTL